MMRNNKGQGTLEYVLVVIIILGVFIAMQNYIKRGFQGRWKASMDDLGDQYDPRLVNSLVTSTVVSNATSQVKVIYDTGGHWTTRTNETNAKETKDASTVIGSFDTNGNPVVPSNN